MSKVKDKNVATKVSTKSEGLVKDYLTNHNTQAKMLAFFSIVTSYSYYFYL